MKSLLKSFAIILGMSTTFAQAQDGPRILAMGDSFLAVHSAQKKSVPAVLAQLLQEPIRDHSVLGARIIYRLPISGSLGLNIGRQYRKANWDWVVLNGGGNDLWLGCGCRQCDTKMSKLISSDGKRGEIPKLVSKLRQTGSRVVYVGYLRSPGAWSPIEACRDEGDELDARIAKLAKRDKGLWFISLADLVPAGDRSFHARDMIHPSYKGSAAAARRIAKVITQNR